MRIEEQVAQMKDRAEADESYTQTCVVGEKVFFVQHHESLTPGHIYSMDGMREYQISRACEFHFDKWFAESEEDWPEDD